MSQCWVSQWVSDKHSQWSDSGPIIKQYVPHQTLASPPQGRPFCKTWRCNIIFWAHPHRCWRLLQILGSLKIPGAVGSSCFVNLAFVGNFHTFSIFHTLPVAWTYLEIYPMVLWLLQLPFETSFLRSLIRSWLEVDRRQHFTKCVADYPSSFRQKLTIKVEYQVDFQSSFCQKKSISAFEHDWVQQIQTQVCHGGQNSRTSWVYMMFCGIVTECRGFQSKNGQRTIYTDSYRRLDRWCLQCLSILLSWASVWVSLHSVITFKATFPKWDPWNYVLLMHWLLLFLVAFLPLVWAL